MNARILSDNLVLYAQYWIVGCHDAFWSKQGYRHMHRTYETWPHGFEVMANLCLLEAEYLREIDESLAIQIPKDAS